jgi:hypothetical protein
MERRLVDDVSQSCEVRDAVVPSDEMAQPVGGTRSKMVDVVVGLAGRWQGGDGDDGQRERIKPQKPKPFPT